MESSTNAFPLFEIIGIISCLVGSAFFSGAETALTHLPETRARQLLDSDPRRFGLLTFWLESKARVVTVLLVGNNLANILCSILGYRLAIRYLPDAAEAVSVFGITIVILVLSEVTPKSIALHYAQAIAIPALKIIWILDKLLYVVVVPLTKIPKLFLGRPDELNDSSPITEDEIEFQIRLGHRRSVFEEKSQGDLLISAVGFSEISLKEIMVPRTDIFGIDLNTTIDQAVEAVINSGHSRIPVFVGNLDNLVGLLHAKDLFSALPCGGGKGIGTIGDIVRRPPMFAPETQRISTLLAKMRRRGQHMAIVVDEFGGTSGLITMEDIIEELVGEIRDEFDVEEETVQTVDASTWIVDAHLSIGDLKDATEISLPESAEYESVGGYVIAAHGSIPKVGTVVIEGRIQTKVLASDARHVERVEIKRLSDEEVPSAD